MKKYRVQMTVSVELAVEIKADSLEDAMKRALADARRCPVEDGLIRFPAKVEYLWNNDTKVTGVMDA